MSRRIVVTGIGFVTPLGIQRDRVWERLLDGAHGLRKLTDVRFKLLSARIAGCIPEDELAESGHTEHPRFIRLAMISSDEAIKDAKIVLDEDAGVSIGSGMSCVEEIGRQTETMGSKGPRRVSPHFVPRILGNMAAGHVCIRHGLRGPIFSPSTACATGASAIGEAFRAIRYGDADVMLAGGTESCIDPLSIAGFTQARALTAKYNEEPSLASRPFDRTRSGFVMGEGAAILVLEELEHARRRGAEIVCEVLGYGTSADAHHITASHPQGLGARLAMSRALREAGISSDRLSFIKAHGTSTPLGDRAELLAVKDLVGPKHKICITSTKGATGHLLSAAGAVETAFTALSLQHGLIPPTRNFTQFDEDLSELHAKIEVPTSAVSRDVEYALSNSFGFGGVNVSLCLGRCKS